MTPEFICTTYVPKKGMGPVTQYFLATIPIPWINTRDAVYHGSAGPKHYMIDNAIQSILDTTIYNIKFIPITAPDMNALHSRVFHRGYTDDPTPFIIRGKAIGEIEFSVYKDWQNNEALTAHVRSTAYGNALTDGQASILKEWFGQQIVDNAVWVLLDYLIRNAVDRVKNAVLRDVKDALTAYKALQEYIVIKTDPLI